MLKKLLAVALVTLACGAAPLRAQDYPDRPIQLIVPFPPGGGTDLAARVAAEDLSARLGQSIVVVNKPGAGSAIGLDLVAKSKPDGYTLAWATSDGLSIASALKSNMPYRIPDDFAFVAATAKVATILVVSSKSPFKSVADLVAHAKANPGKVRYASPGVGTGAHLGGALMSKVAGMDMVHVPYGGAAAAVTAVVGGFIETIMSGSASVKPFTDSGALIAIGVTDKERHPQFPDVPTLGESGYPDVKFVLYMGLLAPAGTPDAVVQRLNKAVAEMTREPKTVARIRDLGIEPSYLDGAAFKAFMAEDTARWRDLGKSANITLPQ